MDARRQLDTAEIEQRQIQTHVQPPALLASTGERHQGKKFWVGAYSDAKTEELLEMGTDGRGEVRGRRSEKGEQLTGFYAALASGLVKGQSLQLRKHAKNWHVAQGKCRQGSKELMSWKKVHVLPAAGTLDEGFKDRIRFLSRIQPLGRPDIRDREREGPDRRGRDMQRGPEPTHRKSQPPPVTANMAENQRRFPPVHCRVSVRGKRSCEDHLKNVMGQLPYEPLDASNHFIRGHNVGVKDVRVWCFHTGGGKYEGMDYNMKLIFTAGPAKPGDEDESLRYKVLKGVVVPIPSDIVMDESDFALNHVPSNIVFSRSLAALGKDALGIIRNPPLQY
ncbi:hypothetical protein B0H14DRAFT_2646623 [Mycena olivaceomarginata]|nr:hypothetical protein B0H14DRAFT_2646623 [Mycena olivaceomarginata]